VDVDHSTLGRLRNGARLIVIGRNYQAQPRIFVRAVPQSRAPFHKSRL
jgi:hypothetical protein